MTKITNLFNSINKNVCNNINTAFSLLLEIIKTTSNFLENLSINLKKFFTNFSRNASYGIGSFTKKTSKSL